MVDRLERLVKEKELCEAELFVLTDNTTVEYTYYKGNSTSPKLFELIVRLHKLAFGRGIVIHTIHMPGTRMIECGVDGLSREL